MSIDAVLAGQQAWHVAQGDSAEVLQSLPDNCIDALICDPPAGIGFMGQEWDRDKGGRDAWVAWLTGIMGEVYRVMKPGAHGFVWALPRTSHWTAWALESAGFELRERVQHLFSTGFPKSHDVSAALDRLAGAKRGKTRYPVTGERGNYIDPDNNPRPWKERAMQQGYYEADDDTPVSDAAKQWHGWGSALKPATEDWWLVRKPLSESSIARNILRWGTGALNIAATRIDHNESVKTTSRLPDQGNSWNSTNCGLRQGGNGLASASPAGRYPSHVVFSHHPACQQAGVKRVRGITGGKLPHKQAAPITMHGGFAEKENRPYANYADPDGYEQVQDWRCHPDCVVAELDRQANGQVKTVDKNVTSIYDMNINNDEVQEVNQWQHANIAEKTLPPSHTMSSEDSGDSVVENVAAKHELQPKVKNQHGGISGKVTGVGIENGEKQATENNSLCLNTDGYGSNTTAQFPKDTKSTTSTTTNQTTESKTCNLSRKNGMTTITNASERTTELNQMALLLDNALDAENTNPSQNIPSDAQVHITDTASHVQKNPFVNGAAETESMSMPTKPNGYARSKSENSPSRFFQQFAAYDDGDIDIVPFIYQSKPASSERNKGLYHLDDSTRNRVNSGGLEHDPRWSPTQVKNNHPTVKSIALMRWLCTLITPPNGIVLDCFAGSGSTGIAATRLGYRFIGIELDPAWARLACERIANDAPLFNLLEIDTE